MLILAARDKDTDDLLLSLSTDTSRDIIWLAANNLLSERRSARWYSAILTGTGITHRFIVIDSGAGANFGAGAGGGVCGDGIAAMPPDFPPVTLYTLEDFGHRDSVLLARGPRDVFYKRTVVPTNQQVGFGSCGSSLVRAQIRIGYLAQLRRSTAEETERLFHTETTIPYTTIEDFEQATERHLKAQEQGIHEFVRALERHGLPIPDLRLHLIPEVSDRRQTSKDPLPVPPPRDISLLTPSAAQP